MRSVFARTGALLVANVGLVVVGVVRLKVAAELFGLEVTAAFGQLSMVQGLIAALCLTGAMTSGRVLMSDGRLTLERRAAVAKRLLIAPLLPTAVLVFLSCLLAPSLSQLLFGNSSRMMISLLIFAAVGSLFTVLNQALIAVHQTLGGQKHFLALSIGSSVMGTVAVVLLSQGGSVFWAGASFTIAPLIQSASLLAAPRLMSTVAAAATAPKSVRFSSHYWLQRASLAIGISAMGSDLILRSLAVQTQGLEEVALLQPAQLFAAQGFALLTGSLAQALLVEQNMKSDRSSETFKRGPWRLAAVVACAYVLVGLAIVAMSSHLITLFFSERFSQAAPILALSLAVEPIRVLVWVGGSTMLPQSMVRPWVVTQVAWLLVQFVTTLLLLPSLGIWSIPVGQVAGITACLVATLGVLRPRLSHALPLAAPVVGSALLAALAIT